MRLALVLLLASLVMAGCATDPHGPRTAGACPLARVATMPVQVIGNLLVVNGSIDDKPVRFLVDTGAERTLLTEETVARLKLPRDHSHATRTYGIGSPSAAWDAVLPEGLVLGGTHLPVDRVTVGRFDIGPATAGGADGLLGADILLAFDLDIDLPAQRLTMYRDRRDCPDAAPPWKQPYFSVAGVSTLRDRLMVPFELDGVRGLGVLDTGAQHSSISERMAARLGLAPDAFLFDRTVMAHGASPEEIAVRLHRFQELRVGPAVMRAPELPVVPMARSMGEALVGADFLHGRRAWLSFSTRQVFITPLNNGPVIAATQAED